MDEQKLENRLTKLEESLDYIGEDIEELKSTQEDIHNLALSVNTLAIQVKRLVDDMCSVTAESMNDWTAIFIGSRTSDWVLRTQGATITTTYDFYVMAIGLWK